ncbi:MAG: exodeoxyribonuclease VII small subunit [Nitrosomonas sp.]|jgi:exodeoxyribonuclease VII small subunit|nr:exodeoxyribonuclease VII small subunit [Nitrosomonas sp.]
MKKKLTETEVISQSQLQPQDFEHAVAELERIVVAMESEQMNLQESLSNYKRGMELLQYCQQTLENSQQQIKIFEAEMLKNFTVTESNEC